MKKKIRLQTSDREIYQKLNMLNIVDEVVINDSKAINNILRKIIDLDSEVLPNGKRIITKKQPINLDIYFR